ncbi:MAG: large subunit ribosomal protein L9 [Candidatus Tokpelaia sp. JSC085]|nr:MAG: large subunit ribosomal protein L9 [Candidatus Tokpelaia sp. JSC085]
MDVILLERIAKLGQMGDIVSVKDGYARNFLLPQEKALRATETNRKHFETCRIQLEAQNLALKSEAEKVADKLDGKIFSIIRSAGDTGHLYGSVSTRDIVNIVMDEGFSITRNQIALNQPIKAIGMYIVLINLHPEVHVRISMNVARSIEEAEQQEKKQDLISVDVSMPALEGKFERDPTKDEA